MRIWLKQIRQTKGLLQKDVARKANVSNQFYSFIENGDRNPSPKVAKRIATVLGFPGEWYKLLEA